MCLYMKLSPFPGVSPDIFNNKHFSPIFVSHRKGGGTGEQVGGEGGGGFIVCVCSFPSKLYMLSVFVYLQRPLV